MKTSGITKLFYVLVGLAAAIGLLAIYYWLLLQDSSLALLYAHNPLNYFVAYVVLTVLTSLLFGVNVALLVYQWRRYSLRRLFNHSGGGAGALLGMLASSCPVCGSTALSFLGIAGGLSSLPFHGLEIKVVSFFLVGGTVAYSVLWLRRKGCKSEVCPPEMNDSLKQREYLVFAPMVLLLLFVTTMTWQMYRSDLASFDQVLGASYSCEHPVQSN